MHSFRRFDKVFQNLKVQGVDKWRNGDAVGLGLLKSVQHDLQTRSQDEVICPLNPYLERIPDREVTIGLGKVVVRLDDSLLNKPKDRMEVYRTMKIIELS